jgi:hypothetical protein
MNTKINILYLVLFFKIALFSCKKEYVPYNDPDDFRNRIVGVYDCTDNFGNNYQIEVTKKYTAPLSEHEDTIRVFNLFDRFPILDVKIRSSYIFFPSILNAKDKTGNTFVIWGTQFSSSTTGFNKFEFQDSKPAIKVKARVYNSNFYLSEGVEYQSKTYEVIGNKIFK